MGEKKKRLLLEFNQAIKFKFCGSAISSNAGLFLYRELYEKLKLTEDAAANLLEIRTGSNKQYDLLDLLRQSVYLRLAGYEDVNDSNILKTDPVLRYLLGGKAAIDAAASISEIGRFETQHLAQPNNLNVLKNICRNWIDKVNQNRKLEEIILDIDSSESEVYGNQEGANYNGYFGCKCYHPLFCFNQFGDLEGTMLRNSNVHSATNWQQIITPPVERYTNQGLNIFILGDAAFARPEFYEYAENRNVSYVCRLITNFNLEETIDELFDRPIGRPSYNPKIFYRSFYYQAEGWSKARRVVAKVEWHFGELFPKVGFLVTNLNWNAKKAIKFYNKRGTAEQYIKEGKNAVKWTKLLCEKFVANEVRLQLFGLAYNLGNFLRTMALPQKIAHWTLTTLREKLIKLGARLIKHARYVMFQVAEFVVTGTTFENILHNSHRIRLYSG